ncbi:MAG: HAD-IC family P-type ATPase [Bacilli bacterium]|nr:HAD-IC family P-type ATPase [Bacilli bacterium]
MEISQVGLSTKEVESRKKEGLTNKSKAKVGKSYLKIVVDNVFTVFSIVLIAIALVFIGMRIYLINTGYPNLAAAYFGISKFGYLGPLFINIIIGTFQEIRSKIVLDRLKITIAKEYNVIRDHLNAKVFSEELVQDDYVILYAGEQVPADGIIQEGEGEVDESILTGESETVKKKPGDEILSGSSVISGTVKYILTKVGDATYSNQLQKKVRKISGTKSELMRNIYSIINVMSIVLLITSTIVGITMAIKISAYGDASIFISEATKKLMMDQFPHIPIPTTISSTDPYGLSVIITTIGAYVVGLIPTGLVLMTSITLAVSIIDLAKNKTLIQDLFSLENLSRINCICLDKTGTLTDGSMSVKEVKYVGFDEEKFKNIISSFLGSFEANNQTSEAMIAYFGKEVVLKSKEINPFSSAKKRSSVIFEDGMKVEMGAPEYLLEKDDPNMEYINSQSNEGFRVLAILIDEKLAALITVKDNIRTSAPETIRYFNENGVEVKIISGDNPLTVSHIAAQCGVLGSEKYISLEGVPLEDIPSLVGKYVIFGRVSPEQKQALVEALQAEKKKVAMTGDGVNDILALRKANCSISFEKATDAAKKCAQVILLDNDFSHLKEVVTQGRKVVNNIQTTSILFLMKTVAIFLLAIFTIPFPKGQSEFTIENIYLLQTSVIAIGGFFVSLEKTNKPIEGTYVKNVYPKALASGILILIGALLPCILAIDQFHFTTHDNAKALISILTTIGGITVIVKMCIPFNKYRVMTIGIVIGVTLLLTFALPTIYIGARSWSLVDIQTRGLDSEIARNFFFWKDNTVFKTFTLRDYLTIAGYTAVALPIYLLICKIIDRINFNKLEKINAKENEQ